MTCEECEKSREIDGDTPGCETERGCIIPPLSGRGARVMALREKLMRLKSLVDPGAILRMWGAAKEDVEMLVEVEIVMDMVKPGRGRQGRLRAMEGE